MTRPELTVVVVTLGDDPRLPRCLEALAAAGDEPFELVLVQNGVEGTGPALPVEPALRLRRLANPGFGAAVNEALERSTGDRVLVLNADATLRPGSLAAASRALGEPGVGAVAFRLLRPEGLILDSAGIRLGWVRRARDRGMGGPAAGRFPDAEDVDAACMAAALFRREALESARDGAGEVMDARFLAYKEDVDLGWRLRRAGWRVRYEPSAVAEHVRGWREGARRSRPLPLRQESLKNRWLMIAKNEAPWAFFLRLPLYILFEAAVATYLLVREPRVLGAWRGILAGLPGSLQRRRLSAAPRRADEGKPEHRRGEGAATP